MHQDRSVKRCYLHPVLYPALFFIVLLLLAPLPLQAAFEQPADYTVGAVLPPKLQKSPNFQVDDTIAHNGLFYHFTVTTPFGTFKEISLSNLQQLIHEIDVIATMKKVETDDTTIASLKQSGKNTVTELQNLFADPEGTIKGAAEGVGSLFNRAVQTVGNRQTTSAEDRRALQLIGFSKAKSELAKKFGVDVYSRNRVLQDELDRLAWADYLGGLGIGAATSIIPKMSGMLLTSSGTARLLNDVINTTPASKLWLQNKNDLVRLGMHPDTVELFLNNPVYTPALATITVAALKKLQSVENLELFLKVGLQASDPFMARALTTLAVMTAGYHQHVGPLEHIQPLARITMAKRRDGGVVVLLPVDRLIWSERIAGLVGAVTEEALSSKQQHPQLWLLGEVSRQAAASLREGGWDIHPQAQGQLMLSEKE